MHEWERRGPCVKGGVHDCVGTEELLLVWFALASPWLLMPGWHGCSGTHRRCWPGRRNNTKQRSRQDQSEFSKLVRTELTPRLAAHMGDVCWGTQGIA